MNPTRPQPLVTRIDLDAIAHNTRVLAAQAGPARLMCVVKADAYNHGVQRCVPVMDRNGADAFGVATFAEARQVAQLTDKPVLAWLWTPGEEIPAGIEVGVPSLAHLGMLSLVYTTDAADQEDLVESGGCRALCD
ncbi:alanine racemase, partial [Corynebacterium godavarianum]